MILLDMPGRALLSALDILKSASVWLIMSFVLAGILRNVLNPTRLQAMLANSRISSLVKATVSGMLMPICSCGVIPLGIGLYYSGAYLGPTLAFMTAMPINPATIVLAYGLLGPQIATIYLITGFIASLLIGVIGNAFAGPEIQIPGAETYAERVQLEQVQELIFRQKLSAGLRWAFTDLGAIVSKYVIIGALLAGILLVAVPSEIIQDYLGNPGMLSISSIALLAAVMYVCSVGHVPFIGALVAAGAAPGLAITFLMAGPATNLPELVSMYRMIGKRAALIYFSILLVIAGGVGYVTNNFLSPGFRPFLDLEKTQGSVKIVNSILVSIPEPAQYLCALIIIFLALYSMRSRFSILTGNFAKEGAAK